MEAPPLPGPLPRNGPAGGPRLSDLAVAVAVQEIAADVGLQHGVPLLSRVGRGQALEGRKAEAVKSGCGGQVLGARVSYMADPETTHSPEQDEGTPWGAREAASQSISKKL